jgi:hypothetical protein
MSRLTRRVVTPLAPLAVAIACCAGGCGTQTGGAGFPPGDQPTGPSDDASVQTDDSGATSSPPDPDAASLGSFGADAGPPAAPCTGGGLDCYVPTGCTTSVSGVVYDPAGKHPIYNAAVFIPDDPTGKLPPITPGTHSCNTCDVSIGNYVAVATTDSAGHFTLKNAPATNHVPLVMQIGKWRREVFLPTVKSCADNPVPAAVSRLPSKRSEGDMPQMALLTGLADSLACFMSQLGIDASEFSAPGAGGRLDIYQGVGGAGLSSGGTAGNCSGASCPLWATKSALEKYDIVLLACEGGENNQTKAAPAMQNMHDWLDEGGKAFATHFHYTWFKNGPADFQGTATWNGTSGGTGAGTYTVDTTFPKGKTLYDWLNNVGAITGGGIAMTGVANSVGTVNPPTQRWIYDPAGGSSVKYLSFLTPIGGIPASAQSDAGESTAPKYCGKAVFTDLHAGGIPIPLAGVPATCDPTAAMTAQELALEFLFFDLSACVAPENQPPPPPPPPTIQ